MYFREPQRVQRVQLYALLVIAVCEVWSVLGDLIMEYVPW